MGGGEGEGEKGGLMKRFCRRFYRFKIIIISRKHKTCQFHGVADA